MNKYLSSILIATFATFLYLIIIELIGVWGGIANLFGFENLQNYYLLIQGALQAIVVLIFIYFIKKRSFKKLIGKTDKKWYLIALVLGIGFIYLQAPLQWIYNLLFNTEYYITYDLDGLPKLLNHNYISSILLIPIGEELFFREYIQNTLQKKINVIVAILIASLLFSLIHAPYANLFIENFHQTWHRAYLSFFGGLLSGLIYYKSKSVGPAIIFHIFWNFTATII